MDEETEKMTMKKKMRKKRSQRKPERFALNHQEIGEKMTNVEKEKGIILCSHLPR